MSDTSPSGQPPGAVPSYHIELRQFPHNACHFNLTAEQLSATVVEPWARERWIEMGELKWNPHKARLTVLEGPHIPVDELSMGRGWRTAQREGRDVTAHLLAAARERVGGDDARTPSLTGGTGEGYAAGEAARAESGAVAGGLGSPAGGVAEMGLLADSLGLELLGQLAGEGTPLRTAWALAAARHAERTAGECLVLAERALASLLQAGLVALALRAAENQPERRLEDDEARAALRSMDSWSGQAPGSVWIYKA
jgi:hypothetical protein